MLLETQQIVKNFGDYRALDDISLGVRQGVVFGLLGPNGAGKTTLIRLINRIALPDSGTILFDGAPLSDAHVSQIGYLPEERGLYKKMRVGEQALYLARLKGLSHADALRRLRHWFDKFQISDWWNRPVAELSKGMQQKVQFIVTVVHQPRLLIFDEPFSGFDPLNADLLKKEILTLREQGATVIFSTHNMASVEELCDDIALINKSRVVLNGAVDEIRRSFSQRRYEVVLSDLSAPLSLPSSLPIVSSHSSADLLTLTVDLTQDASSNDLVAALLPQCHIVSLREILPSMNDIFIQTVKETQPSISSSDC